MIQLSPLSLSGPENPRKSADAAAIEGLFESFLAGETGEASDQVGKILPQGGKTLPESLPARFAMLHVDRKPARQTSTETGEGDERGPAGGASPAADSGLAEEAEQPSVSPAVDFLQAFAALPPLPAAEPDKAGQAEADMPAAEPRGPAGGAQDRPDSLLNATPNPADGLQTVRRAPVEAADAVPASRPLLRPSTAALSVVAPLAQTATQTDAAESDRPVDAAQPRSDRPQPIREIKFDLASDSRPQADAGKGGTKTSVVAQAAEATAPRFDPAQPVSQAEVSAVHDNVAQAVETAERQQAPRPHDLAQLVDRLVEARENARSANASLTVMHAEFGEVALRFGHEDGNLTVSLANNDPGFFRAVNAAIATDMGAASGEPFRDGRREEGGQAGVAREALDPHAEEGRREGQPHAERRGRPSFASNPPPAATSAARKALGGIFA